MVIQNTPRSLPEYRYDVIGFGHCGRAIAGLFHQLGLEVRIVSAHAHPESAQLPYSFIRWIENEDCDPKALNLTSDTRRVEDFKGRKLLLFTNAWSITWAEEHNKELRLSEVGR